MGRGGLGGGGGGSASRRLYSIQDDGKRLTRIPSARLRLAETPGDGASRRGCGSAAAG